MDLSKLDTASVANEGAVMEVTHPVTQEPLKQDDGSLVTITLAGIDSDIYRRAVYASGDRVMKVVRAGQENRAADLDNDKLSTLAVCTLAWSGIELDGQKLDCTRENARKLYMRVPWLREQADTFIANRANFLKASAKHS